MAKYEFIWGFFLSYIVDNLEMLINLYPVNI